METLISRGTLHNTAKALKKGKLTVGFTGGSITEFAGYRSWAEPTLRYFTAKYPEVKLISENTAIGATGSLLGTLLAPDRLISHGCDLVFVEFAVNDQPDTLAFRTREGLIRKLLRSGETDVVIVYTYKQDFYASYAEGKNPTSVEQFETIAEHYGLGTVNMGLYAINKLNAGLVRYYEWLPDGLHPNDRGSVLYGEAVAEYLDLELARETKARGEIPAPLDPLNFEFTEQLPLDALDFRAPWILRRSNLHWSVGQYLETFAPGAELTVPFEGRAAVVRLDYGGTSGELEYSVDGGETKTLGLDSPSWAGERNWQKPVVFDAEGNGKHTLRLKNLFCPSRHGTRLSITGIYQVK